MQPGCADQVRATNKIEMKQKEQFSFIVSSYNLERYLRECVESLVRQNYEPENFEVICIDDGSTDSSFAILQDYAKKFKNVSVEQIANSGLEKACNRGIKKARFERIVRVDADDVMDTQFLDIMNASIQKQPQFDFYYPRYFYEYYSAEEKAYKGFPDFDPEEIFERGDFFATATVYKKKDIVETGYLLEDTKNCGLENYNLILRLISKGKIGLPVDGTWFYYRRHHLNMSTSKRDAIIDYGKKLLASYGKEFKTNQYHPYGLKM